MYEYDKYRHSEKFRCLKVFILHHKYENILNEYLQFKKKFSTINYSQCEKLKQHVFLLHLNWPLCHGVQVLTITSLLHSSNAWLRAVTCVGPPVSVVRDPLCASRSFSICRPTGCYPLTLIQPFLLWLLYRCKVVFYPSQLKFAMVDGHVHSEIICCRKMLLKTFSYALS